MSPAGSSARSCVDSPASCVPFSAQWPPTTDPEAAYVQWKTRTAPMNSVSDLTFKTCSYESSSGSTAAFTESGISLCQAQMPGRPKATVSPL